MPSRRFPRSSSRHSTAPARAGAAELSLACDMRLAAAHATFRLPEALWGGFPGAGGPVRLPDIVGRARALELICTGREIDAAEMERLGLVLAVYPADRLRAEAQALGARIGASGPIATRGAKRIMNARRDEGFAAARHALRRPSSRARVEPRRRRGHGRAPRGPAAAIHRVMSVRPKSRTLGDLLDEMAAARPHAQALAFATSSAATPRCAPASTSWRQRFSRSG